MGEDRKVALEEGRKIALKEDRELILEDRELISAEIYF